MFFYIIKEIWKGKSLLRSLMNKEITGRVLKGKVIDIGAGANPSYYKFFQKTEQAEIFNIDLVGGFRGQILDLEKNSLPYPEENFNQALMFNILEHLYNYKFVLSEARRVLKTGGEVVGFVPFFINIHPDPHDYFRYSREAIEKIFKEAGFHRLKIKAIGFGPLAVNYNNLIFLLPKFFRIIIFPFYYFPDLLLLKIRTKMTERFPLGYFFTAVK